MIAAFGLGLQFSGCGRGIINTEQHFQLGLKIDRVSPLIYVGDEWANWIVVRACSFYICSRPTKITIK